MSGVNLAVYSPADFVTLGLLGALVVIVALMAWRKIQASRLNPEELERRRRRVLAARGKMGDATVVDVRDNLIFYSYDVRGMEYTASQDVSALKETLVDLASAVGPVAVKYDARNPANSIIIAEEWSGIRRP
jgi:hypothetical protein